MVGRPMFTGGTLDRAYALRADANRVSALLDEPTASFVAATSERLLVEIEGEPALRRIPARDAIRYLDRPHPILLGLESGAPLFAIDLEQLDEATRAELADGRELVSLRAAGARLGRSEAGLAVYLMALLNWHRAAGFCPRCGTSTEIIDGGASRRCPGCAAVHFPRNDPAVIMLVEHEQRLLLGRQAAWPGRMFSVLAGFVAPGESLEQAVIREVKEEAGIDVSAPSYVTSQPWPFPSSLMLGFEAHADDAGEPRSADGELEQVGWYDLDRVAAAARGEADFELPPPVSIARTLIDRWLARAEADQSPVPAGNRGGADR